jgi:hypothetical protein
MGRAMQHIQGYSCNVKVIKLKSMRWAGLCSMHRDMHAVLR